MKNRITCGLDVGSAKLCVACGRLKPEGKIDILASHIVASQGKRANEIIDGRKLSACIKDALAEVQKKSGIKVRRVYASIDTLDLKAKTYEKKLTPDEQARVQKRQFDSLISLFISQHTPLNRKVFYTGLPDCMPKARFEVVLVSALIPSINTFIRCIKDAGLILEDLVPSGCAQALSFRRDFQGLTRDNILIDIGAGLTKLSFFKNNLVREITILPFGAQQITEDIAARLKLSGDCAEKLKIKYGRILGENIPHNQRIIVKDKGQDRVVSAQDLHRIIIARVDQLLHKIKKALLKLEERQSQIIVSGGGSILEGFLERAEKTFQRDVKMGFLYAVADSTIQAQSALYATSVGLIHYGARNKRRNLFSAKRIGLFKDMLNQARQLYQEYF
jgi:cell division protein FtsA